MNNSSQGSDSLVMPSQAIIGVILSPIIFGTIFGNLLVIVAVAGYRKLQTFTNYLLLSLASADLMVGVLVMPFAYLSLIREKWEFGQVYCSIWATVDVLLCTASILNLCAISIDRYCAITWPLRYIRKRNDCLAAGVIACVWSLSAIICAPPWFNIPQWSYEMTDSQCTYVQTLSYRIYSASGSFFIPLCIMITVYWRIFKVSITREKALNIDRKQSSSSRLFHMHRGRPKTSVKTIMALDSTAMVMTRVLGGPAPRNSLAAPQVSMTEQRRISNGSRTEISRTEFEDSNPSMTGLDFDNPLAPASPVPPMKTVGFLATTARAYYERTVPTALVSKATEYYSNRSTVKPSKEKSVYLKERKALKTIGLVVMGFVLCWFPFFVFYILESACENICTIPDGVGHIFLWLGYSNSSLNPLIYAAYHRDFKRCFRDILTGGCCKTRNRKSMSVRRLHQSHL